MHRFFHKTKEPFRTEMNRFEKFFLVFIVISMTYLPKGTCRAMGDSVRHPHRMAARIHALHDRILDEGRTVETLTMDDMASLPVGIVRDIGGQKFIIAIDGARFTPKGAFFDAYISLPLPFSNKKMAFAAKDIAIHPGGLAASTDTKLTLVEDSRHRLNKNIELVLPGSPYGEFNYVAWDCSGFKEVNLKGVFEFDRNMIVPDRGNGKVTATFETVTADPGNIMASVSISPFRLTKLKDLSFEVQRATVDYSDLTGPPGMAFPDTYRNEFDGNMELWQGFFLESATVRLPEELSPRTGRKSIGIRNMLIDNSGVTGAFGAGNLFGREDGSLNGWPFSIDSLGIVLERNRLKGGAFKGSLQVPLFDGDSPMEYEALISQRNGETDYLFAVTPGRELNASVLAAKIQLDRASTIIIEKKNGKLMPSAILHGKASINAGTKLSVNELEFQDLHLITEKPYILSGVWALRGKGQQRAANFPISINNVTFVHDQQRMALNFEAALALMDREDKGFGATTKISVKGKIEETRVGSGELAVNTQQWKYDKTTIDDIYINAKDGAYELEGKLSLYDEDPVYGNGFRGQVKAWFQPGIGVDAIAQFGNVEGLRYWYADAAVRLPNGAPISPGIAFYGFGGGMYYHMSMQKFDERELANATASGQSGLQVGASASGLQYVPGGSTGLGFRAGVTLGTHPSPTPFNGDASFEIAFNRHGGAKYIIFRGEGFFMQPIGNRSSKAPLYADLMVSYDFNNRSLHANLDTYVNMGLVKGIHKDGLAGSAVMHFSPETWYIHIGTPDRRIGLNFLGLVKTGAYFMVGKEIPGMPTPPETVSEILGGEDLDFMRDENALGSGAGIAFGSSMEIDTGKQNFLIFYGQFGAGLGFDIMLKNYGNASCAGRSGPLGINGWYASGQAWAYVHGRIGIKVNLKFVAGEFDILSIGAAAVLQAKLPNPIYMQGMVGGHFDILGGLVKGHCKFKLRIGEECEIIGASSVTGVKAIAELKPTEGSGEVSVFTAPQAAFNLAVGREFEMLNNEGQYRSYRVKLDHFKVFHKGRELKGDIEFNGDRDVAIFNAFEILPPNEKLEAEIKITWEEKKNGRWIALSANGKVESETERTGFRTGEAPKNIPENNVAFAYPVPRQYNFLKREHPTGYMKLKMGQSYLFRSGGNGQAWKFAARFTAVGLPEVTEVPLSYDAGKAMLAYDIPRDLRNERAYTLELIKLPMGNRDIDANVRSDSTTVAMGGGSVSVASNSIEGTLTLGEDRLLHTTRFRTSRYDNFGEKLNAARGHRDLAAIVPVWNILKMGHSFTADELFDRTELSGWRELPGLVQVEALPDNKWFSDHIDPVLYADYPLNGTVRIGDWRAEQPAGVPPLKGAVSILQDEASRVLEEGDGTGALPSMGGKSYLSYDMEYYTYMDHVELRDKAYGLWLANRGGTRVPGNYVNIMKGRYNIRMTYTLPGLNRVTTQRIFTIKR